MTNSLLEVIFQPFSNRTHFLFLRRSCMSNAERHNRSKRYKAPFYYISAYIHVSNIVNLWTLSHRNFRDDKIEPLALRAINLVCKSITLERGDSQTEPSCRVTFKHRLLLLITLRNDVTHIYTLSPLKNVTADGAHSWPQIILLVWKQIHGSNDVIWNRYAIGYVDSRRARTCYIRNNTHTLTHSLI